ncbi:biopolymer transporter ExbD [candidate division KSB1 bacterium]|nr:biopolymer transporter ExbD [candidate division KSB1 bacterium]
MAGLGGEMTPSSGRKKSGKKKMRRLAIRIDMTPMLDIAFLLLTFFMLTSVFPRPQTMETNMPPKDVEVEVGESNLLTLRVISDGTIFWNMGIETPQKVEFRDLRNLLEERNQSNPKLVTLIKVDRKSKYSNMVDVMDELQLARVNRFSLAEMKAVDFKVLEKAALL